MKYIMKLYETIVFLGSYIISIEAKMYTTLLKYTSPKQPPSYLGLKIILLVVGGLGHSLFVIFTVVVMYASYIVSWPLLIIFDACGYIVKDRHGKLHIWSSANGMYTLTSGGVTWISSKKIILLYRLAT